MKSHPRLFLAILLVLVLAPVGQTAGQELQEDGPAVFLPVVARVVMPAQWVGPGGGSVVSLAYGSVGTGIVYAGSWGAGVFRSGNGGTSWQPVNNGLGNLYINKLAADPVHSGTVYAGTYRSGVYKTTDGGGSWAAANDGILAGAIVYALAVDPADPQRVYCGVRIPSGTGLPPWSGILYRSLNGGASWSPVLENVGGPEQQDWVYSIAVHPLQHNLVLAATHEHGPYRSTDYGQTWQPVSNGIGDGSGRAVVFDPLSINPITAYLGVWHRSGVFKTVNGGDSWSQKTTGILDSKIYDLAIDPQNPDVLFAATFQMEGGVMGMAKSTNSGETWAQAGLQNELLYSVAVAPNNGSQVLAGSVGGGVFRTTDGGQNWVLSSQGLYNSQVTRIQITKGQSHKLFALVAGRGVYRSLDAGGSWTTFTSGLGDLNVHELVEAPDRPGVLFALSESTGLYVVDTNTSTTWQRVNNSFPRPDALRGTIFQHPLDSEKNALEALDPGGERISAGQIQATASLLSIAFAPSQPQTGYLGTGGIGVYKSINGGASWVSSGLGEYMIYDLVVDPRDENLVFAAINDPRSIWASNTGGQNWFRTSPEGLPAYWLEISAADPDSVYAGTNDGVYRRWAGGEWEQIGLAGQSITALAAHPERAGMIVAGIATGAYISVNGGASWQLCAPELNGIEVRTLTFDPNDPRYLYAGTTTHSTLRIFLTQ